MVWSKLKKLFRIHSEDSDSPDGEISIHRMVNQNQLNKRKNVRINYPYVGAVGLYPRVSYLGHELNVNNISLGGLLVVDDTDEFGDEVGEVVVLGFFWPDFSTKIRCRLVGANLQRRHIQFVDFNPQAFLRIGQIVKAGHMGQRFHRVHNDSGTLQAEEMWVGPTGESLVFTSKENPAELSINKEKILIKSGSKTISALTKKPISSVQVQETLVLLANFPKLSPNVKQLVEALNAETNIVSPQRPNTRTGSYG